MAPDQQMKEQESNHCGLVADLAFHGVLPAETVVEATVINRYKHQHIRRTPGHVRSGLCPPVLNPSSFDGHSSLRS